MLFKATILFSLAVSALALPSTEKRAAAGVLTTRPYADFQISDGVGGDALAAVQAKFPIDESNLAGVAASDVAILSAARKTAENAEVNAFNPAIAKGGADAAALQVGKIRNKVMKLKLEVLGLQIKQAQGGGDQTAKIAEEQTKLNNNIATDTKNAGKTSQSVVFTG
ncbi:unnamed protein product [Discula destructiva]